jgi:hypothetical protein
MQMWTIQPEDDYTRRLKKWPKKYRRELLAVHDNLDTYLSLLNSGTSVEQAKFGFVHVESGGALAIDQKGAGASTLETRLYIYPDKSTEVIHLITLGDKQTQKDDNELCRAFVKALQPEPTVRQITGQKATAK